jgi:hypothetical protein
MQPGEEGDEPHQARRRRRWPWFVLAGVVAWVLIAGWDLAAGALDLQAGKKSVDAARATSSTDDLVAGRPTADLRRAARRLGSAHRHLNDPILTPVRVLPVVGRQLRSAAAISGAAATVADAGATGLTRARVIIDREATSSRSRATAARELSQIATDALVRLRSLSLGPRSGLVGPLAQARADLAENLTTVTTALERGAAGGRAVATLLDGPRRYLVFAANNAEMRAGSGMFLSVGELDTGDGLRLGDMQSVTAVPLPTGAAAVPLEGDLPNRWGWLHPSEEWRNLMLSPRFDVQAPLAVRMWTASGHGDVDGVLALDPLALKGLLQATGPVTVDGRQIDSSTVVAELLHDQYTRFGSEDAELAARREGLGRLARATFDALNTRTWKVADLARGLLPLVEGRHLLAWSKRADDQGDWSTAGVDGSMAADSLLVALSSRAGNKLDQYVHISSDLETTPSGAGTAVTMRVTLANDAPTGQPKIITGPTDGSGVGEGTYVGVLSVTLPGAARHARIDGVPELTVAGPDGPTRVIGLLLPLDRGQRRTLVVHFDLPERDGSMRIEPSARVPAIAWQRGGKAWTDAQPHVVRW